MPWGVPLGSGGAKAGGTLYVLSPAAGTTLRVAEAVMMSNYVFLLLQFNVEQRVY